MSEGKNGEVKEGHCPLCRERVLEVTDETDFCPTCHRNRFFDEDRPEIEYRTKVRKLTGEIKKKYQNDYNPEMHDELIKQLVRSQMQCRHYERIINNNNEKTGGPAKLLQNERVHERALYNMLQVSLQGIRGDKKNVDLTVSGDFADVLRTALAGIIDGKD